MRNGAPVDPDDPDSDVPDILGDGERRGPPQALRRAVVALLAVVLVAAYGPELARSSGASRLLSADAPSLPAPSAAPDAPSSSPSPSRTWRLTRVPTAAPSPPEEPSPSSMLSWPIRGDLAADVEFGEAVSEATVRSGVRGFQLLWLGTVPGGRLALGAELTGTGGVEISAVHVPRGASAARARPEPAGAVYDGNSSLVGWVGPMVRRERALVVLGPPRTIEVDVSYRIDNRRDGSAHRRWRSYTARRGELVTVLAEPVSEPVLVRRPGQAYQQPLRLGFDPGRVPRTDSAAGLEPVLLNRDGGY